MDLEVDTFVGVVSALKSKEVPPPLAAQYIIALSKSSGFAVNVMFLDEDQRKGRYHKCYVLAYIQNHFHKTMAFLSGLGHILLIKV